MECSAISIVLTALLASTANAFQATSVSGFYRIEVELGMLENTMGYQANGQYCDEITACDPVVYTSIDVEKPLSNWPSKTPAEQIMLTWRRNTNSYAINQTVYKDICGGGLSNVNARIEIMDEDFLGKYDLIEQFECKFFPPIADTVSGVAQDDVTSYYKEWAPYTECKANHQPNKIRLTFRWRVYPIEMAECGMERTANQVSSPRAVAALPVTLPVQTAA